MADFCTNHPHREAKRKCFYCKAPICPSCQLLLDHHYYCSDDCNQKWKSENYLKIVKTKAKSEPDKMHARQIVTVRQSEPSSDNPINITKKVVPITGADTPPGSGVPISLLLSQIISAITVIFSLTFAYLIVDRALDAGFGSNARAPATASIGAAPSLAANLEAGGKIVISGEAAGAETAILVIDGEAIEEAPTREGKYSFTSFRPKPEQMFAQIKAVGADGEFAWSEAISLVLLAGKKHVDTEYAPDVMKKETAPPKDSKSAGRSNIKQVKSFERGSIGSGMVSLTFDGGADNNVAANILDTLKKKSIKSTIFLTGMFIKKFPELTRRFLEEGHEVGNHTYTHPHLTTYAENLRHNTRPEVTKKDFINELRKTEMIFEKVTGRQMTKLWRAPYGEMNNEIRAWADSTGYTHVGWTRDWENGQTLDSLDWVDDPTSKLFRKSDQIHRQIVDFGGEKGPDGGIVLMHLGTNRKEDLVSSKLDKIIDDLRNKGLKIVPVSKMIQKAAGG